MSFTTKTIHRWNGLQILKANIQTKNKNRLTNRYIYSGEEYYEEEWSRVKVIRVMMRNGKARLFWYDEV